MHKAVTLVLFATLATSASVATAHAQSLYAGLLGGYAASSQQHQELEPYGGAIGASAGVTLPVLPIYLGARMVWFVGNTETLAALVVNRHYLLYGVDVGYDAIIGPLVLRPSVGIGRATLEDRVMNSGLTLSSSDNSLYIAPGFGLLVKLLLLYVGAELRYNALTASHQVNSVSLLASFGLTI